MIHEVRVSHAEIDRLIAELQKVKARGEMLAIRSEDMQSGDKITVQPLKSMTPGGWMVSGPELDITDYLSW